MRIWPSDHNDMRGGNATRAKARIKVRLVNPWANDPGNDALTTIECTEKLPEKLCSGPMSHEVDEMRFCPQCARNSHEHTCPKCRKTELCWGMGCMGEETRPCSLCEEEE
jgi:hypothetical protein